MTDPLYDYLLDVSLRENDIAGRLRAETAEHPQAAMQISPEQGQFMGVLVRLIGARHCIEVGTFTGYSTLCVALSLPDDGRIVACDVSEEWTAIGRAHWREAGVEGKIDLRIAPALETLDQLLGAGGAGEYDFMFIDADKSNYLHYYERGLKLLRTGGLIAVDNVLWGGSVIDPVKQDDDTNAIRELNRHVKEDSRVDLSMVPIGDGLTLARKR
jgi:predicted O-methyltransferase YrrM